MSRAAHTRRRAAGLVSLALLAVTCTSQGAKASKNAIQAAPAAPSAPSTTVGVRKGGSLNYAAGQEPPGFNVNTSAARTPTTRAVMDQLWPSVFDVGPDFKVTLNKDLMVSAVLTKQSPQTVVLKIDPQASWSDGVPITADDFIYFWQRQRDPAHTTDSCTDPKCPTNGKPIDDSSDGTGYRNIELVTGTDEGKTVTVVFSAPFADWRLLWSNIVPAHMAQKVGWNSGFDSADPNVVVSGGPFKIQSYHKGSDLTLVPNDKYWARQPNLDAIVFHFIPDPAQQVAALISSTADLIHLEPQLDLVSTVAAMKDVHSEITFGPRSLAVDFNVKTPGLDDLVVRKAIATAIDRPSLLRLTVGQFTGAQVDNNRMFVDKQPQYQDTSAGLYSRADLAKAKQMLEQDGYALGSDGVYAKGGRRLSFRISATAGDALGKQAESVVQGQLALAGVDVKIDNAHNLVPGTPAGKYDFDIGLFATVHSPFPSDSNVRYSQVGSRNYGQSGNALLDEMLDLGAAELDADKQAADYNQADALIWQNMWTLPLFQEPAFLAVRSSFRNVHENVNPEGPFWNAQTWGLMPLTP